MFRAILDILSYIQVQNHLMIFYEIHIRTQIETLKNAVRYLLRNDD